MSTNSIPSLSEILSLINSMKAFNVNDYIITTTDGNHQLNLNAIINPRSAVPIKLFIVDDEKQFIYFEFANGQIASLNHQDDDWIITDNKANGVYLIHNPEGLTKIGIADDPYKRLRVLQTGSAGVLSLLGYWPCMNAVLVEKQLHKDYKNKCVRGEWFNLDHDDIDSIRERLENKSNRKAT
jgi:hypothetical protein